MRKRVLASALVLAMAATSLYGCGNDAASGTEGQTAAQEETAAASENGTEEAAETGNEETAKEESENTDGERETLVVGIQTNTYITDYDDNYMTNLIEEELNVNLEFYQLPSTAADMQTKISLMASSGDENMPDVFMLSGGNLTPEQVLDYGTKGFFIPLNSYVEDSESNYAKIPEEDREKMDAAMTSADGNMYALPNYCVSPWNDSPNRMFINGAWLDKLGLEVPKTTDELYEVLKAFKENDANGNGVQDELGVYGFTDGGYGQDIIDSFENPDLAFKLGDWFMDIDNSRIARWGEEGVDWTSDPEVCAEHMNGYVDAGLADEVNLVYLTNIWSEPSNKYWHNTNSYYEPWEAASGTASGIAPYDATSKNNMLNAQHIEWYYDKHPEHVLPLLHYTSEEASQCTEAMVSIADLVEQAKAEFITGVRDLDSGWDAYLEELESVGLSSWLEIAQTAYERSQAN
ncbi:MAG: hypothetical protein ACLU6W_07550 [Lachnospiraceae bacterium]